MYGNFSLFYLKKKTTHQKKKMDGIQLELALARYNTVIQVRTQETVWKSGYGVEFITLYGYLCYNEVVLWFFFYFCTLL